MSDNYLGQSDDRFMNVRFSSGCFNLLLWYFSGSVTISNVISHGQIEQNWFLLHETKERPQPTDIQCFDIVPVEKNSTAQWIIKSLDQGDGCRFSTTRRTNERRGGAGVAW